MTPIPPVLTLADLSTLLQMSKRKIFDFRQSHAHPAIVELPSPNRRTLRFDGRAVTAWLEGGPRAVRRGPRQPGTSLLSVQRRRVG